LKNKKKSKKESMMETKQPEKTALTILKDWITPEDLRSVLALIVTLGGLAVIATRPEVANCVVAIMLLVLGWYFKTKEKRCC